jgi:threonine aldolase
VTSRVQIRITLLEKTIAELFGKEAALFVPSGTMGNIVSIAAHCKRGDEAIVGQLSVCAAISDLYLL